MDPTGRTSFVLVPGFWLGAWAWEAVASRLTGLGHSVDSVTLPGAAAGDSTDTTLFQQVDALAAVVARQPSRPVLVAHSGAGRVATGVLDRDPEAVQRVVYVDSGPAADESAFDDSFPEDLPALPLPEWDVLTEGGASLEGISETDLATFRERAVPVPGPVVRERLHLTNEGRLDVPTTIIACSLSSQQMTEFAQQGVPMFAEVTRLRDLTLVDLPTGHWPMWSRPADLSDAIAATG